MDPCAYSGICKQTADELRAENAKLRAALEKITELPYPDAGGYYYLARDFAREALKRETPT